MAKSKSQLPSYALSSFERKLRMLTPVLLTGLNLLNASLISDLKSNQITVIKIQDLYTRSLTAEELKSNIFILGLDKKLYPLTQFLNDRKL